METTSSPKNIDLILISPENDHDDNYNLRPLLEDDGNLHRNEDLLCSVPPA